MLAYLITEPQLSTAGALDATLDAALDDEPLAALAYEAAPAVDDARWIPARRRPGACSALRLA